MDAVLAVAPDAECRDGASIRTPLPGKSRCGPVTFYNRGTMRNDLEGESVGF